MQLPQATPWFDGHEEPLREGPYQRRYPAGPYSCWAQGRWYGDAATPQGAAAARAASRFQDAAWRGSSTPPQAPCAACRGHRLIDLGIDEDSGEDLITACEDCDPA